MKDIDDKTIEKALWNIKSTRKLKPIVAIIGIVQIVLAGFLAKNLLIYADNPFPEQTSSEIAIRTTFMTIQTLAHFGVGIIFLLLGLCRNYKDVIIECLAEQYLKERQKND